MTYLVKDFGVSEDEARLRIKFGWAHIPDGDITTEPYSIFLHEEPSYWAHSFYYGSNSFWWITGDDRAKHRLPPLVPVAPSDISLGRPDS